MNLKGIKKKSALKFLRKNLKGKVGNRDSSLEKIKKIGILAEVDLFKTYDFTRKLSENFGVAKNNFDVLLCNNDYGQDSLDNYLSFSEKDFGLSGKVKSENLKKFIDNRYDLLIDYCNNDNVFARIICLKTNARLIAGFENEEFNMYDISIKLENNRIDTFNEELTKYLQILNLLN